MKRRSLHVPRYRRRYTFEYKPLTEETFLAWKQDEVAEITIVRFVRKPGMVRSRNEVRTIRKIPAAYIRIVDQLENEADAGQLLSMHEVLRRATYAEETLDAFGIELIRAGAGEEAFRSKVLNPLMMRQLRGVMSNYGPNVRNAIEKGNKALTIRDVTTFYFEYDPIDAGGIASFRRNLIYTPEARWHLSLVLGLADIDDAGNIANVWANQDSIMESLNKGLRGVTEVPQVEGITIPAFNTTEIEVIICEKLERYFAPELALTVCRLTLPPIVADTIFP